MKRVVWKLAHVLRGWADPSLLQTVSRTSFAIKTDADTSMVVWGRTPSVRFQTDRVGSSHRYFHGSESKEGP
jgi:hypothetical protein